MNIENENDDSFDEKIKKIIDKTLNYNNDDKKRLIMQSIIKVAMFPLKSLMRLYANCKILS